MARGLAPSSILSFWNSHTLFLVPWLTTSYPTTLILQGQAKINILGSFSGPFTLLCTFIPSFWGICVHCYFCLYPIVLWSLTFLSAPPATWRAPHRQTPCLVCLFISSTKAVPDMTSQFLMTVGWMNKWTQITRRDSSLLISSPPSRL